jgi:hypothetical protein
MNHGGERKPKLRKFWNSSAPLRIMHNTTFVDVVKNELELLKCSQQHMWPIKFEQ